MVVKQEVCMIIFPTITDNSLDYRVRYEKTDPVICFHFLWLKS